MSVINQYPIKLMFASLTVLRYADDELGDRRAPRDLAGDLNFSARLTINLMENSETFENTTHHKT